MSFYLFRRYFLSRRSGSLIRVVAWICLSGMAISVAALILIVSIMGGFGKAIKSRLLSQEAHLVINFEKNPFFQDTAASSYKNKQLNMLQENNIPLFSSLTKEQKEGIKEIVIFETQDLILKSSEEFKGVTAIGYSKQKWDQINLKNAALSQGNINKYPNFSEPSNFSSPPNYLKPPYISNRKEILLSQELSLVTGLFPGDDLILIPLAGLLLPPSIFPPLKKFKVKSILQEVSQREESFFIYYKQGLIDFGDFSNIQYKAEIKLHKPEQFAIYQNLFKEYNTQNWVERNSQLFFALKMEKFIMTLFLFLSLLISCLGISSALFLLMTQKGEDLAMMQAMGLSSKELVKIFTRVGLYLSLIGLLTGAFIGIAGTLFLKYNNLNFLPEMYQDRTIPAIFVPLNYALILLGAFFIAWISSYLPTRYLCRIKPAQLLKISY